ncbi:uncharacterized protein LOC106666313 isoform X1 [Cimex lectularius]|uniref:Uncharacterized protein n=1 Tax=Cimex lectularius TaxID=79782 RepID=A0A8I6RRY1_CIMLE|nr:uncharacterized protein LOC106666313 isoform X1 [Cimex lectularius]
MHVQIVDTFKCCFPKFDSFFGMSLRSTSGIINFVDICWQMVLILNSGIVGDRTFKRNDGKYYLEGNIYPLSVSEYVQMNLVIGIFNIILAIVSSVGIAREKKILIRPWIVMNFSTLYIIILKVLILIIMSISGMLTYTTIIIRSVAHFVHFGVEFSLLSVLINYDIFISSKAVTN